MFQGELIAIRIASDAAAVMQSVDCAEAITGTGLKGDRYAELKGVFQKGEIERKQQVTLVEIEAIEAATKRYDLTVTHQSSRRNLLTSGAPLNHLVGVDFWVGEVQLRGVKLCEPCSYLDKVSGAGHLEALLHRGGLRAEIIQGGQLRVGDVIRDQP